jgi:hypothetical protein
VSGEVVGAPVRSLRVEYGDDKSRAQPLIDAVRQLLDMPWRLTHGAGSVTISVPGHNADELIARIEQLALEIGGGAWTLVRVDG